MGDGEFKKPDRRSATAFSLRLDMRHSLPVKGGCIIACILTLSRVLMPQVNLDVMSVMVNYYLPMVEDATPNNFKTNAPIAPAIIIDAA